MNKHTESSPLINIVVVAGILGAISAAVAVHPKGKQIKEHIINVGDDFAGAFERAIDKIHGSHPEDEPLDISKFALSVLNELHDLNDAAVADTIQEKAIAATHTVEDKATTLVDDVGAFAHWFQKKGKALARKGLKDF